MSRFSTGKVLLQKKVHCYISYVVCIQTPNLWCGCITIQHLYQYLNEVLFHPSFIIDDLCHTTLPFDFKSEESVATTQGLTNSSMTNRFSIVDILSLMSVQRLSLAFCQMCVYQVVICMITMTSHMLLQSFYCTVNPSIESDAAICLNQVYLN